MGRKCVEEKDELKYPISFDRPTTLVDVFKCLSKYDQLFEMNHRLLSQKVSKRQQELLETKFKPALFKSYALKKLHNENYPLFALRNIMIELYNGELNDLSDFSDNEYHDKRQTSAIKAKKEKVGNVFSLKYHKVHHDCGDRRHGVNIKRYYGTYNIYCACDKQVFRRMNRAKAAYNKNIIESADI